MAFPAIMCDRESGETIAVQVTDDCAECAIEGAELSTEPGGLWEGWDPIVLVTV